MSDRKEITITCSRNKLKEVVEAASPLEATGEDYEAGVYFVDGKSLTVMKSGSDPDLFWIVVYDK